MKKVLVIDDDVDFLSALEHLLKSFGYQLVPGTSSDNIEAIIQRIKPAFIILDVFIGKEDGRKVFEEIRHLKDELNIPVVLCSGLSLSKKELENLPGVMFIPKPLSTVRVKELIETLQLSHAIN